jgi:hypothetical protein
MEHASQVAIKHATGYFAVNGAVAYDNAECARHYAKCAAHSAKLLGQAIIKEDANRARRERDDAMRSLGLVKVRGPVSGKIYWE